MGILQKSFECYYEYSDLIFSYSLQTRSVNWGKTVLRYTTDKSSRLPIVDVALRDIGEVGQSFWVEVSPVCFY